MSVEPTWYECPQCDAAFLSQEAYNGHMGVHGGEEVILHE